MNFVRNCIVFLLCSLSIQADLFAKESDKSYFRNFWSPSYHTQALSYCSLDGKICGLPIASEYCKIMGYEKANKAIIANNIGISNFLNTDAQCRGWECNGFKLIRCVSKIQHNPPAEAYYRSRKFVFPRYDYYRVAWCYKGEKGCGARAAYSFCRRMGYLKSSSYSMQKSVKATKALGDQKLCFGETCKAFKQISCYR